MAVTNGRQVVGRRRELVDSARILNSEMMYTCCNLVE